MYTFSGAKTYKVRLPGITGLFPPSLNLPHELSPSFFSLLFVPLSG